jgi:hypothetical protein
MTKTNNPVIIILHEEAESCPPNISNKAKMFTLATASNAALEV